MSADRELLILAAKAAGMKLVYAPDDGPCQGCQFIDGRSAAWNPLTDDGDALRLAVALALAVSICRNMPTWDFTVILGTEIKELHDHDPHAATRRAIVRAAAEIGKAMP